MNTPETSQQPVGRPRVLDDVKRSEVCALISAGCGMREAARYVRCGANTIRREAERNPDFQERLRRASLYAELSPLNAMQQAVKTHWRAAAWLLERTKPTRFGRPDSNAITPKRARNLAHDLREVVCEEIKDPLVLHRIDQRMQIAIRVAFGQAFDSGHRRRELRRAIEFFTARDNAEPMPILGLSDQALYELIEAQVFRKPVAKKASEVQNS